MRLSAGQSAKDFRVQDIFGTPLNLQQYTGKTLLLSFYKWASCPLCNLRMHHLIEHYPRFQQQEVELLAFFHSPAESLRKHLDKHNSPFPIVADSEMKVYRAYGVEKSLLGMMLGGMRMGDMVAIMRHGFMSMAVEGDLRVLPADFLIGPDQRITIAYYGRDIGDHLPINTIEQTIRSYVPQPA